MMSLKPKISNRKFYNKWLYKVSLRVVGSYIFRRYPIGEVGLCSSDALIIDLDKFLSTLPPNDYATRVEFSVLDIYVNDAALQQTIIKRFSAAVRNYAVPSERVLDSNDNELTIFANRYAHNRYRYKVFLHPHKINSREDKIRYLNWLATQGDKIRISEAVKQWFIFTNWNWDRRYLYVEDEQTLLMLKIRSADAIGPIYKIKIPINT